MRKGMMKRLLSVGLSAAVLFTVPASRIMADGTESLQETVTICIDAGHGGETDGAKYVYDGVLVTEKEVNLRIALKLEEELLRYENVEVVMTRTGDVTMELKPRVEYALEKEADYLISVHNNAPGSADPAVTRGCMVLSTVSHYQAPGASLEDVYGISERLSLAIVSRLTGLGIPLATELGAEVNGVVKRPYSPEGYARSTSYYPDGSVADYYALIRYGVERGLPTIIIEHAYLTNGEDYRNYLETDESVAALARADAEGIAEALGLQLKPEERAAEQEKLPRVIPAALTEGRPQDIIRIYH